MNLEIKINGYEFVASRMLLLDQKTEEVELKMNDEGDSDELIIKFLFTNEENKKESDIQYAVADDNKTLRIKCINFNRSIGTKGPFIFAEFNQKEYAIHFWNTILGKATRRLEMTFWKRV